mmetsp:Transcript_3740/g.9541  ORF Transcript_3740/g.9541 Transcript_3740/m.9541 type:complete len:344 (-) Transcript_3740:108-1139(-)|eukprot:4928502-Amphidinium_carterae.1
MCDVAVSNTKGSDNAVGPETRIGSAMEVFNIPLFEIPPVLDVRSAEDFRDSHIMCAVSLPLEEASDLEHTLHRIVNHSSQFGWDSFTTVTVVHNEKTSGRAEQFVQLLNAQICEQSQRYSELQQDFSDVQRLLVRMRHMCKRLLLLSHDDFASTFPQCVIQGDVPFGEALELVEKLGPLPRCVMTYPRLYVAGRQVCITERLMRFLGTTHMVANADWDDVHHGTTGGRSSDPLQERPADVSGVRYLKCDITDKGQDQDTIDVLRGAAEFLDDCQQMDGVGLVSMHGQSRGTAVVCAYLIAIRGHSVSEAWAVIERSGMEVDTCKLWWSALQNLSKKRRLALEE